MSGKGTANSAKCFVCARFDQNAREAAFSRELSRVPAIHEAIPGVADGILDDVSWPRRCVSAIRKMLQNVHQA
jgi:hypothetical protein